jgi:hypothetical protein
MPNVRERKRNGSRFDHSAISISSLFPNSKVGFRKLLSGIIWNLKAQQNSFQPQVVEMIFKEMKKKLYFAAQYV